MPPASDVELARFRRLMEEREREHGVVLVAGAAARRIFDEVAGGDLQRQGFAPRKDGSYARVVSTEIIHLVALMPLRQDYAIQWGVSLTFVPHGWKERAQYHRTVKAARFDLFVWPPDADPEEAAFGGPVVDGFHGESPLRADLTAVWGRAQVGVLAWLDGARSVAAIAALALEQTRAPGFHHPPPALVRAFCLARLGQAAEARSALDELVAARGDLLPAVPDLLAALERAAQH